MKIRPVKFHSTCSTLPIHVVEEHIQFFGKWILNKMSIDRCGYISHFVPAISNRIILLQPLHHLGRQGKSVYQHEIASTYVKNEKPKIQIFI
jgi:hypothetical protein